MRKEDLNKLKMPYTNDKKIAFDRRFELAIEADIPSAGELVEEIFNDLDVNSFGISWWTSLPSEERILISDYLYQCANGIEVNIVEAKLHYLEWIDARERHNDKIANVISIDNFGKPQIKMPAPQNAQDDLLNKLEGMHICGFFRAIGSSLDCLGATIIGVLALPCKKSKSLRKCDIKIAEDILTNLTDLGTAGSKLQNEFKDFFERVKNGSGPTDWLDWADQYRNMFVHRGRRISLHQIIPRETPLYDSKGNWIPRAKTTTHLAKYPDRSDVEAFIKGKDIQLNEDAEITLNGLFKSVRKLNENICSELLKIWKERRNNPTLLEQPLSQWDDRIKPCNFKGYDLSAEPLNIDLMIGHPITRRRLLASSLEDSLRNLWIGSKWE